MSKQQEKQDRVTVSFSTPDRCCRSKMVRRQSEANECVVKRAAKKVWGAKAKWISTGGWGNSGQGRIKQGKTVLVDKADATVRQGWDWD